MLFICGASLWHESAFLCVSLCEWVSVCVCVITALIHRCKSAEEPFKSVTWRTCRAINTWLRLRLQQQQLNMGPSLFVSSHLSHPLSLSLCVLNGVINGGGNTTGNNKHHSQHLVRLFWLCWLQQICRWCCCCYCCYRYCCCCCCCCTWLTERRVRFAGLT